MKRALEEVVRLTDGKRRMGYSSATQEHPIFRHQFNTHEASYRAARSYVMDVFADAEAAGVAGRPLNGEQIARITQVNTWLHGVMSEVVGFCHLWGGTSSFRNPSALGRCTRDAAVATQHVLMDPITLVNSAPSILDSWRR
jgi:hypothetical protein